jgi:fermentation-respiration switch protein FrsA (DUF1100 family)
MDRWRLVAVLTSLALGGIAGCAGPLARMEQSIIYHPTDDTIGDWRAEELGFEDAWFASGDATRLHGWYASHPRPRAVVLFCHGNAGNVSHRTEALRMLRDRVGVSALVFDYRGYGRSEGEPDEPGILADARAARAWLARRAGIPEHQIVLMGRSLGGAVAVDLAADGARGLVLESTFSSIRDVGAAHYPWLPVRMLMRTRLASVDKIAQYHGPLLQSHGDADRVIPYRLGRRLFDAANEPKRFITIPDADHNDPQPPSYYDALVAFLDQLP